MRMKAGMPECSLGCQKALPLRPFSFIGEKADFVNPEEANGLMPKRIFVKVAAPDTTIYESTIMPGTTAWDVLEQMGLIGFRVIDPLAGKIFPHNCELYPAVREGAALRICRVKYASCL